MTRNDTANDTSPSPTPPAPAPDLDAIRTRAMRAQRARDVARPMHTVDEEPPWYSVGGDALEAIDDIPALLDHVARLTAERDAHARWSWLYKHALRQRRNGRRTWMGVLQRLERAETERDTAQTALRQIRRYFEPSMYPYPEQQFIFETVDAVLNGYDPSTPLLDELMVATADLAAAREREDTLRAAAEQLHEALREATARYLWTEKALVAQGAIPPCTFDWCSDHVREWFFEQADGRLKERWIDRAALGITALTPPVTAHGDGATHGEAL